MFGYVRIRELTGANPPVCVVLESKSLVRHERTKCTFEEKDVGLSQKVVLGAIAFTLRRGRAAVPSLGTGWPLTPTRNMRPSFRPNFF